MNPLSFNVYGECVMASKNAKVMSVRLMLADIQELDRIAAETGKSRNAVIVAALRKAIQAEQTESTGKGEV